MRRIAMVERAETRMELMEEMRTMKVEKTRAGREQ
jgi:hypothetical protein